MLYHTELSAHRVLPLYSRHRESICNILCLRFRDLLKYRPGKILLHLCCNLCVSYVIFVSGISNAVGNPAACAAVTFLLHYFFLVSWTWMGVYSYEIYMALVKVSFCFDKQQNI